MSGGRRIPLTPQVAAQRRGDSGLRDRERTDGPYPLVSSAQGDHDDVGPVGSSISACSRDLSVMEQPGLAVVCAKQVVDRPLMNRAPFSFPRDFLPKRSLFAKQLDVVVLLSDRSCPPSDPPVEAFKGVGVGLLSRVQSIEFLQQASGETPAEPLVQMVHLGLGSSLVNPTEEHHDCGEDSQSNNRCAPVIEAQLIAFSASAHGLLPD